MYHQSFVYFMYASDTVIIIMHNTVRLIDCFSDLSTWVYGMEFSISLVLL